MKQEDILHRAKMNLEKVRKMVMYYVIIGVAYA